MYVALIIKNIDNVALYKFFKSFHFHKKFSLKHNFFFLLQTDSQAEFFEYKNIITVSPSF